MDSLIIGGQEIEKGKSYKLELPLVSLYTSSEAKIPVFVRRGRMDGPTLFISAAIHGDELNGVEIISRIINHTNIKSIRGTLICVPFVNPYGVVNQTRYLPDRRDLNRSFPGSKRGSLAARVAHTFLNEIVSKCDYGIDLHTGAIHRSNLPQIRANINDEVTLQMAKAFNVPVILNSDLRDGSLREAAVDHGVKILLYEAGEALRFDEVSIKAGVRGIMNVLRSLQMLPNKKAQTKQSVPYIAQTSSWLRAPESGFVVHHKRLGDQVNEGDILASIKDPFGVIEGNILASETGVIIGKQNIPLVHEGEAVYHVAYFKKTEKVVASVEAMEMVFNN
ncbi:succinylglutamate desuccinylase [Oleiphilus sp. HI0071]|jgi:predicted deacylase|uniref:succinylglutamate desuccinylase/aspartoacylase family protein n=1 Tax=unclassified Oleiphilus TaxID=2631174 RepID=UPI0007C2277F|nr:MULTISPECIES: succinylglutamate desuccinylase/aspartoacylase family protein [unclassified Oleiphilus]KZY73024.1 succinylglutamate desuccinylase [Oleiphilus sp. HI0065]KZY83563.1 succinylglutamate desuccinylase [Oleiphilus sp. HI0071]KZY92328.1 succinylglutamate desuccinylase [Oleiphilus sp. HI0073]KZZ54106.1 succinylglutamate desuccinylase [Oleiphilus sp. HI0118]KZZ59567.1 succinylglutamate desuccinylase [Oleiphilus sp. HI0122]KZZ71241.1 succinylglutamate desuccinylase [Oleiphilus sp. HI01